MARQPDHASNTARAIARFCDADDPMWQSLPLAWQDWRSSRERLTAMIVLMTCRSAQSTQ